MPEFKISRNVRELVRLGSKNGVVVVPYKSDRMEFEKAKTLVKEVCCSTGSELLKKDGPQKLKDLELARSHLENSRAGGFSTLVEVYQLKAMNLLLQALVFEETDKPKEMILKLKEISETYNTIGNLHALDAKDLAKRDTLEQLAHLKRKEAKEAFENAKIVEYEISRLDRELARYSPVALGVELGHGPIRPAV